MAPTASATAALALTAEELSASLAISAASIITVAAFALY